MQALYIIYHNPRQFICTTHEPDCATTSSLPCARVRIYELRILAFIAPLCGSNLPPLPTALYLQVR